MDDPTAGSGERRHGPTVDPVTGDAVAPAPNREPAFVVPGRDQAAAAKMAEFTRARGAGPTSW